MYRHLSFFEKPGELHFGREGKGTQGPPPMISLPLVLSLLLTEGVSPGRPLGEERVHYPVSQNM